LPICIISADDSRTPLVIPKPLANLVPRGLGNREIVSRTPFRQVAGQVATVLKRVVSEMGWLIERIAIDAPAAPGMGARKSENEICRHGLSYFRTPDTSAWIEIRTACMTHLSEGGAISELPHANKIWMLYGFELFSSLRRKLRTEVIETYPYAVVRTLLPICDHKSTETGYRDQLRAVAERTGWKAETLEARLKLAVSGTRNDRLDAYMAAWLASLPPEKRRAYGDARLPNDAIWVPLTLNVP
jgi:Protein of unknown function (DUF429)